MLYLPVSSAVCGPGGGSGAGASTTEWAGTAAYRVGAFHIGVRVNDPETADVIDRLLPGARVQDRRVPDNFSVALYPGAGGGSRRLNLLVRDGRQLVRSRSAARALAALLTYVSADTTPPDEDLLPLNASAALLDGTALLLPPGLVNWNKQIQTTLARRGIVLVDAPYVTIDLASAELVVPTPSVPHDPEVLAELDRGARLGPELPYVRPGRYPIARLVPQPLTGRDRPALARPRGGLRLRPGLRPTRIRWSSARGLARLFERVQRSGRLAGPPGSPRRAAGPGPRSLTESSPPVSKAGSAARTAATDLHAEGRRPAVLNVPAKLIVLLALDKVPDVQVKAPVVTLPATNTQLVLAAIVKEAAVVVHVGFERTSVKALAVPFVHPAGLQPMALLVRVACTAPQGDVSRCAK